ncbi:LmbE-like protein, partial [Sistotremastrum niveocremeum HHB9708]
VLLLTAHPDDEVMFFSPTIFELLARNITVISLCLSTGNADGLGEIRRNELSHSLDVLGIGAANGIVLDHPQLQDNISLAWHPEIIASVLLQPVLSYNINAILTFDSYGVSGHPNHASLPAGASHLLRNMTMDKRPSLYSLRSMSRLAKFTGPMSIVTGGLFPPIILSSYSTTTTVTRYLTSLKAMAQHRSQLVWFRYLYVLFSRYMFVNEWNEV